MDGISILLWALLALPLVAMLSVFALAMLGAVSTWAKLRRFARRPCERCGTPFGRDAVRRADEERRAEIAELLADAARRNMKLQIAAIPLRVRCPKCDAVVELML